MELSDVGRRLSPGEMAAAHRRKRFAVMDKVRKIKGWSLTKLSMAPIPVVVQALSELKVGRIDSKMLPKYIGEYLEVTGGDHGRR